jgi:hypothetical protein
MLHLQDGSEGQAFGITGFGLEKHVGSYVVLITSPPDARCVRCWIASDTSAVCCSTHMSGGEHLSHKQ